MTKISQQSSVTVFLLIWDNADLFHHKSSALGVQQQEASREASHQTRDTISKNTYLILNM